MQNTYHRSQRPGSAGRRGVVANQKLDFASRTLIDRLQQLASPRSVLLTLCLASVAVLLPMPWRLTTAGTELVQMENSWQLEYSKDWREQMQYRLASLEIESSSPMYVTDVQGNPLKISWSSGTSGTLELARSLDRDDFPLTFQFIPNEKPQRATRNKEAAEDSLNPSLKALLMRAETQEGSELLDYLGGDAEGAQDAEAQQTLKKLKTMAELEVSRILSSRGTLKEILGPGTRQDQDREFRRIARLLHPDKNLVSAEDPRANLALRIVNAVRRQMRK